MASLFGSRRKAKRVGREPGANDDHNEDEDSGPVVRKPTSNTPKTKSKLRLSFNPGEATVADASDSTSEPRVIQKRPLGSDRAQSLLRRSWGPNTPGRDNKADRPTYSKDFLNELRNSTPATPKDLSAYNSSAEDEASSDVLDISNKFGAQPSSSSSHIPSAAEIQEKKERRARLAKSQGSEDFIALEDYDSDGEFKPQRMQVSTFFNEESEKDTRLIHDDEDLAEGFDSYVDDPGKVTLSRKAQRLQVLQQRRVMADQIRDAEDSSSESDSEAERNYAYESTQTSHGMDGLSLNRRRQANRPQAPKEVTPIPKLAAVLARFREGVQGLEFEVARLDKRWAHLQKEKLEIVAREENIQSLLVETGEKFEKLKGEAEAANATRSNGLSNGNNARGLESLGRLPGI